MAQQNPDPFANTGKFQAFSTQPDEPARRKPSPLVYVTAIVALAAILGTVLIAFL